MHKEEISLQRRGGVHKEGFWCIKIGWVVSQGTDVCIMNGWEHFQKLGHNEGQGVSGSGEVHLERAAGVIIF